MHPGQQQTDLVGEAFAGEAVAGQLELAIGQAERGDPHLGGAGKRPSHRAGLLPGQVREDRLALGRRVELEHLRVGEPRADPLPQIARHARADEHPDRVEPLVRMLRRIDDAAQRRPRVADVRRAVAPHLVPERVGVVGERHREPRTAGDRATDRHQQCRRVVQRRDAAETVSPGRSAAALAVPSADNAHRLLLMRIGFVSAPSPVKSTNAMSSRALRIRPVPAGTSTASGVDALHVDDAVRAAAARPNRRRARSSAPWRSARRPRRASGRR